MNKKRIRKKCTLTSFEDLQIEVVAVVVSEAGGAVQAGHMMMLLHGPRGTPLELLQEAVDLVLNARRRAGHFIPYFRRASCAHSSQRFALSYLGVCVTLIRYRQ